MWWSGHGRMGEERKKKEEVKRKKKSFPPAFLFSGVTPNHPAYTIQKVQNSH
jgi:hypothetical protein